MHLDELIKIKQYETIQMVLRRHWLTYLPSVILYMVLACVPIVLYFLLLQTAPGLFNDSNSIALVVLVISTYELSVALFFYSSFLIYYLDMLIITNDRMVEVSQRNLFSRTVSELDLYKIQDTTSDVSGVIATIFNYGTLSIQSAAEKERFVFEDLPDPNNVRRKIMDLAEEDRKHHMGAVVMDATIGR